MEFHLCNARTEETLGVIFTETPLDFLEMIKGASLRVEGTYFSYVGHAIVLENNNFYCYVEVE